MIKLLLLLFLLVAACVTIHGIGMMLGLRWLSRAWPRSEHYFSLPRVFWILIRVVFGLLILHVIQITVWAACYNLRGCFPDFETSFYYSATSYSTVGYGDVVLPSAFRILGAMEAVTGVLMFGWSTGVLFSIVNQLQRHFLGSHRSSPLDHPPSD